MDTNPFDIAHIITKRFKNDPLDSYEQQVLDAWIQAHPKNKVLFDELMAKDVSMKLDWLDNLDEESAWRRIEQKQGKKYSNHFLWRVAATITLICSLSLCLWFLRTGINDEKEAAAPALHIAADDVSPALLGAKIILANGKEVKVDDTLNIASSSAIIENELDFSNESVTRELIFHTLVVPAANFFKITLSDGTTVWVNAASELRFPAHF